MLYSWTKLTELYHVPDNEDIAVKCHYWVQILSSLHLHVIAGKTENKESKYKPSGM